MSGELAEIVKYMQIGARLDLKAVALTHVLGSKFIFLFLFSLSH